MAGEAPVDYSYSPSGSTIELIDLASAPQSSRPSSRISSAGTNLSWHPKLTLYRLLVILSTVGLAAAKTATSCLNLTFASITLEWISGVVVFIFCHILGAYEETTNPYFAWLFNFDCMECLWDFQEKLVGFRPTYISHEIDPRLQAVATHPAVTGYRIIVTVLVASLGMTKSVLLYGQEPTEATTVECVFGVGIVTCLYWLGLYEASSTKAYPKLFHVDYSGGSSSYIRETAIVFLHLLAILFCSALSYGFYLLTASILSSGVPAKAKLGTIEYIVVATISGSPTSIVSLAGTLGVFAIMYHLGLRYLASPLGQFIIGLPGVRLIPYVHRTYWLPSAVSFSPRPRLFYLKRFTVRQIIKIPLNLCMLYGIMVAVIYFTAFFHGWYSLLMDLLGEAPWYGMLMFSLGSLFIVPVILTAIAVGIYFVCKGFIAFIIDAWKDLTVDVELVDAPV
ncbi:hypothetical protein M413DRAFT_166535 [Hebeloma cylindrosporum]|uniref:Uncharacterized protein n=1 Tax=Hebeloma cylindrosporum TaxID=76867 RepID=A0A0C3C921_HEBCY|nr:hypothetical protein M413DRAFT_166535 [Hebeloma cylindrosporum h7]